MTKETKGIATKKIRLRWTGTGMEYLGNGEKGPAVIIDGKSEKGPGPMDALLYSLAGCMAVDVQSILEKSRVPLSGLEVEVEAKRAPSHPKYYTGIKLVYRVEGPQEEHGAKLDRAVSLSREKFCLVLHSLRSDIDIDIDIHRTGS